MTTKWLAFLCFGMAGIAFSSCRTTPVAAKPSPTTFRVNYETAIPKLEREVADLNEWRDRVDKRLAAVEGSPAPSAPQSHELSAQLPRESADASKAFEKAIEIADKLPAALPPNTPCSSDCGCGDHCTCRFPLQCVFLWYANRGDIVKDIAVLQDGKYRHYVNPDVESGRSVELTRVGRKWTNCRFTDEIAKAAAAADKAKKAMQAQQWKSQPTCNGKGCGS